MQADFPELKIIFSIDYMDSLLCLMEQEPYQRHLDIKIFKRNLSFENQFDIRIS